MKKTKLFILATLLCISAFTIKSQVQTQAWQKPDSVIAGQFDGTHSSFVTLSNLLQTDTTNYFTFVNNYSGSGQNYILIDPNVSAQAFAPGSWFANNITTSSGIVGYVNTYAFNLVYTWNLGSIYMLSGERSNYVTNATYTANLAATNASLAAIAGSVTTGSVTISSGANTSITKIGNTYTINSTTPTLSVVGGTLSGTYPTQTITIPNGFTVNPPNPVPSHSVINTAYQPNISKGTNVSISVVLTSTVSLSGGQTGEVQLQYSSNGSTWNTYSSSPGSSTGGLVVGLSLSQNTGGQLSIELPPAYYWRWTTTGTGTFVVKNIFETPIN